jgi:hypothetical protein
VSSEIPQQLGGLEKLLAVNISPKRLVGRVPEPGRERAARWRATWASAARWRSRVWHGVPRARGRRVGGGGEEAGGGEVANMVRSREEFERTNLLPLKCY